jgi:hypothetical protein
VINPGPKDFNALTIDENDENDNSLTFMRFVSVQSLLISLVLFFLLIVWNLKTVNLEWKILITIELVILSYKFTSNYCLSTNFQN